MQRLEAKGKKRIEISGDAVLDIADGSQADVVIRPGKNCSVEMHIGKKCRVRSFVVQGREGRIAQTNHIGAGSRIDTFGLWVFGGEGEIENLLEGEKAEAHDSHVFVERGTETFRLNCMLRHAHKDTKGDVLVKGVVKDSASARLDGMIKVERNGAGAESFLSEHVILLNPGAHAIANPELEIENNDVSSRHSASVSQISAEKIFYLMARGLRESEAKALLVEGFLQSAIERIDDKELKNEFGEKVKGAL